MNALPRTGVRQLAPRSRRAQLARAARVLSNVRGWRRLVNAWVPDAVDDPFVVRNGHCYFAGNLGSYIDRQTYLFGQYERGPIERFMECVPRARRGTVLDVGANAGTHSSVFGLHFSQVHSFEPNPELWQQFSLNMKLNGLANVTLHRIGLADAAAELPLHATRNANLGLGTFMTSEQYSEPLQRIGSGRVERGDDYLASIGVTHIDALKIDVQGFEPRVLAGLRSMLEHSRPVVWFELGAGTDAMRDRSSLAAMFPYPVRPLRIATVSRVFFRATTLVEPGVDLGEGDYLVLPE